MLRLKAKNPLSNIQGQRPLTTLGSVPVYLKAELGHKELCQIQQSNHSSGMKKRGAELHEENNLKNCKH